MCYYTIEYDCVTSKALLYFLCRELFNAAFVSCWMELRPIHQEDLVTSLKQALTLQNIPEITQTILNLAEFMEHCEEFTVKVAVLT